jgi:hypothetical protein
MVKINRRHTDLRIPPWTLRMLMKCVIGSEPKLLQQGTASYWEIIYPGLWHHKDKVPIIPDWHNTSFLTATNSRVEPEMVYIDQQRDVIVRHCIDVVHLFEPRAQDFDEATRTLQQMS